MVRFLYKTHKSGPFSVQKPPTFFLKRFKCVTLVKSGPFSVKNPPTNFRRRFNCALFDNCGPFFVKDGLLNKRLRNNQQTRKDCGSFINIFLKLPQPFIQDLLTTSAMFYVFYKKRTKRDSIGILSKKWSEFCKNSTHLFPKEIQICTLSKKWSEFCKKTRKVVRFLQKAEVQKNGPLSCNTTSAIFLFLLVMFVWFLQLPQSSR